MTTLPNNIAVFLCRNRWINRHIRGLNSQKGWIYLANGFKFFLHTGDISGPSFITARRGFENYETDNRDLIEGFLNNENAVFIDIGANIGNFSISALLNNPTIRILAFEPMPLLYECFKSTIKTNGISNIKLLPCALSDEEGESKLFINNVNFGNHSLLKSQVHKEASGNIWISVQQEKLDDRISEYNPERIDAMKIDVEGFELQVLKGATNTISKYKPSLLIECRNNLLITEKNVGNLLQQIPDTNYMFRPVGRSDRWPLAFLREVAQVNLDNGSGHSDYLFENVEK